MTFTNEICQSIASNKNKQALLFYRNKQVETELTFAEIGLDTDQFAHFLASHYTITKGDRVLLYIPKSIVFILAYIAIQKIGAIAVPLNPEFKEQELHFFLENAAPKLAITGVEQKQTLQSVDPDLTILPVDISKPYQQLDFFKTSQSPFPPVAHELDDPAHIMYTSGTTGNPKGAILTQKNLASNAEHLVQAWDITNHDLICHVLPLFHAHGLCFAFQAPFLAGAAIMLLDSFDPSIVLDLLSRKHTYSCSVFMGVPTIYHKLLEHLEVRGRKFGGLRLLTSGSAPLLPNDFRRIQKAFGQEPVEREGMTETNLNFTNPLYGEKKPGSIGLPVPELEVRLVNPATLSDVPSGQEGEIWLRGPNVSPGYWKDPDETAKAFHAGWFRTGDLGKIDAEGYFYLTDRLKDIIISGGENISPKEVERVLNQHPGIRESSVLGIPDDKFGERVVAAVVEKKGCSATPEDLQQFCRERLHKWKCPKEFVFFESLAKNTMGKVLKEDLKKSFKKSGEE